MSYSCIVYIYAVYLLLDHALCTLYDRGSTGGADDTADDDDDEIDFSYENDLYRQIPNPFTEEEYQRLWASDEDSGDSDFGGFDDVDDARCG